MFYPVKKLITLACIFATLTVAAANPPEVTEKVLKAFEQTFVSATEVVWHERENTYEDLIITARQKLVDEKILKPESLNKGVEPKAAHEHGNYDWRYLTASFLFK